MTNASEWAAREEQHRHDDEQHEERDYEPPVHARADIDSKTFPCGLEADVLVLVGADADVTCDGCNAELERRERRLKAVLRTATSLVFALGHAGRSHALYTTMLRDAVNAKDFGAIGHIATEVVAFAKDLFWTRHQDEAASRFLAAVDTAGLRRSRGSLQDALDAMPTGDGEAVPL